MAPTGSEPGARMKSIFGLLLVVCAWPAQATLSALSTVPEWAALAREIAGSRVDVVSATTAFQDPHHLDARPSLIARARKADLLLATGADLEVGWLPLVVQESGNARIQPGKPGYFEAAAQVQLQGVPARIDRADGDVHAAGNPHVHTDPRNLLPIAAALAATFARIDPANEAHYRAGHEAFATRWQALLADWEARASPLRGLPVVSQHQGWLYLYQWLGLREVATLEPRPGVEPSLAHLAQVRGQLAAAAPRMVIRAAYNSARPAQWFAREAAVPEVVLPYTVGGAAGAETLEGLYGLTLDRLLEAAK